MGIFKRKVKDGFNYYIQYYDQNGRRHKETIGKDYRLAKRVLEQRKGEIVQGKFSAVYREDRNLFEDFVQDYLNWSRANKKSWLRDEGLVENLMTHFKGKYLDQITPYLIEKYKADRIQKVKPATVNRELALLKALFNKSIIWDKHNGDNPVKKVKLLKEENTRVRYLIKEEMLELLKHCSEKFRPMVICALNTGMRRGEIFNLKWKNIDWKSGLITVEHSKSGRSRAIPMNQQLYDTLKDVEKTPGCPYVFNNKGNKYTDIKKPFQRVLKKAGIEDFRWHDLRHNFASHLVMAGVNLKAVMELLGHQSITTTIRYAHLSQENKKIAVSLLSTHYPRIVTNLRGENGAIDTQKQSKLATIGKSTNSE